LQRVTRHLGAATLSSILMISTHIRGHGRLEVNHYFSPRTNAGERFWIPAQTYAADGDARPNQGAFRFVGPALHILPTYGRKAPQERFSEEGLRTCTYPETH
jgi:hypothetical protein